MRREFHVRFCEGGGVRFPSATRLVCLAKTEAEAHEAWGRLQAQFQELHLVVNQDKSRLTTATGGFTFLGFDIREVHGRLYLWPSKRAQLNVARRLRETARSFRSSERLEVVIRKLNPVLNGWCTYFRVGNSNRAFHKVDWAARSELQLWLRRKHRVTWRRARGRWGYRFLHERCRLYRMVGKVSHLEGLR